MKLLIFGSVVVIALAQSLFAQDDWHTYPYREIADLLKQEQNIYENAGKRGDIVISAKPFPAKTRVTYMGLKRPAGHYTRSFIKLWVSTRNVPAENADLLVEEHLFKEKGVEYWLPVHGKVAPSLATGLKSGDEVIIYYFYLGGFNGRSLQQKDTGSDKPTVPESDTLRWILAVERVEMPRADFALQILEKAIDRTMEQPGKITEIWFDPRQVKSKAKLVFTGEVRPVSGKRARLRDLWMENYGFPAGANRLMESEARFLEGDKEHWIIVRTQTLAHIQENIGKGGSLLLNTILAGAVRNSDQIDWVFMAGEYSK